MSEVEIIEGERLAMPSLDDAEPETVAETAVSTGGVIGPRMVGLASAAVFVLALAILTRPGLEVAEVPVQTTAVPAQTTTSVLSAEDAASVQTLPSTVPVTLPIPLFDETGLPEIPGVITGVDPDGGLITIDRATVRPTQDAGPGWLAPTDDPITELIFANGQRLPVSEEVIIDGDRIVAPDGDENALAIAPLVGAETGLVLVVSSSLRDQTIELLPFGPEVSSNADPVQAWTLDTQSLDVLGWWRDRLVVGQAGTAWLYSTDGAIPLGEGEPVGYNGDIVVQLHCQSPGECVLRSTRLRDDRVLEVAVPDSLRPLAHDAWLANAVVSPDGRYLGGSSDFGAVTLPFVIDLETGESFAVADGMNRATPVSWSPDSQWLSYVYTDDVMVWSLEAGRSWRVQLNRPVASLAWN